MERQPFDREVAVRFKTNEAVSVQDPEVVLRALETCLRDVSSEVVRDGDKIILRGLGPSLATVNYQDTTVLSVSAENNETIINADVKFQASALLGNTPQDAVVRSKLDQVFDNMRTQIDMESRMEAASSEAPSPTAVSSSSTPPVVAMSEDAAVAPPAASVVPTPVVPLETTEKPAEDLEAAVPLRMPQAAEEHWDQGETGSLVAMLRREIRPEEPELGHQNRWRWLVSAMVALILAAGFYLWRSGGLRVTSHSAAAPSVATTAASSPAGVERTVTKINGATITPRDSAAAPSDSAAAPPDSPAAAPPNSAAAPPNSPAAAPDSSALSAPKAVADPKDWLEEWAAAMGSRDPAAQVSFYADPVNQYINRRNVSHAALVQAKKADIGRRHGVWTFSVNDVVVESRTPTDATVGLVKHYRVEAGPSQVSEISVRTRLRLKIVDGQWKIISEEELPGASAARVDPIDQ
jgi:hypothetical protein